MTQSTCIFSAPAYLSCCNPERIPTLKIKGNLPSRYTKIIITESTSGKIITPAGFNEAGLPYFSDEFY